MKRLTLTLVALVALGSSPAAASFTGSIYYSNFADHHVRRLDVAGSVAGSTTDLATLPGADGLIFDPTNHNRLLAGGQLTDNIYGLPTTGGAFTTVNSAPIVNGAFHLGEYGANQVLAGSQEGPHQNGLALVNLSTHAVDNRLITGTAMNRVSGVKTSGAGQVYITDSQNTGVGGQLYTVNLGVGGTVNPATLVNVASTGSYVNHDIHSLWFDHFTGHLFAGGMKHLEEIDLNAGGGPKMVRDWDLSALIPETPANQGHIDQVSSDDFGNMFAASNSGEIIYLDLTGAGTPGLLKKAADVNVDDIVVGPSAVPEPATLLLAGLGLLGASLLRKRA